MAFGARAAAGFLRRLGATAAFAGAFFFAVVRFAAACVLLGEAFEVAFFAFALGLAATLVFLALGLI